MFIGIIGVLIVLVLIALYGCLRTSTDYDKQVEDEIQEAFLRQYQKNRSSKHEKAKASKEKQ